MTALASVAATVAAQAEMAAALFDRLRQDGRDEPGITRDPFGAGEQRAHATIAAAAERLGLEITRDSAANLYMTLPGRDRAAPAVVIGSHLDSVPHGGNFDGAAGVVAGLISVASLQRLKMAPACDVTVMGIRAEESVWFQVSYIGSRAALGRLPEEALQVRRIDSGRTLAEHIAESGGNPQALGAGFLNPARLRAYLELHIEQAPSLIEADRPVAVCTGIPGNFRYPDAWIEGSHDHVGLPRRFRRDAALAGAEFAMALDALWEEHERRGVAMAITLGRFHTDVALHGMTVVPGKFHFSLDVRAYDNTVLAELDARVDGIIADVERRRGVRFHLGAKPRAAVGVVDPTIRAALLASARELGIAAMELGSPASHDAAAFAAAGVPTGMILVRNENGSHNPQESMSIDDFLAGTSMMTGWLASTLG